MATRAQTRILAEVPDPAQVEHEAKTLSSQELAAWMQEHLGQQLTAYLAGLRDPKMVGRWASTTHKTEPQPLKLYRLQAGYQAARLLSAAYGDSTARSWLFGTNTALDDEAPAWVLRHGETPEDWRHVMRAAKTFVSGDWI